MILKLIERTFNYLSGFNATQKVSNARHLNQVVSPLLLPTTVKGMMASQLFCSNFQFQMCYNSQTSATYTEFIYE